MRILLAFGATVAMLFAFSSQASAAPNCTSNFCNGKASGAQCSLNGATHTCGTCSTGGGGTSSSLYVGALSASTATAACQCQYDRTSPCSAAGRAVLNNQNKRKKTAPVRRTRTGG